MNKCDETTAPRGPAKNAARDIALVADRGGVLTNTVHCKQIAAFSRDGLAIVQTLGETEAAHMSDPFDFELGFDDEYDNDELDAEALRQDALRVPQVLPPPWKPMDVARVFIDKACLADGFLTLHHWRGGWWLWRTSHWIEAEDRAIRALLYRFTEKALYATDKGEMKAWAPTKRKIGDLSEALAAICILPADRDQPS
jgi:hypothetical protein